MTQLEITAEQLMEFAIPLPTGELCDSCYVPAYVQATLKSGGELFFCRHHFRNVFPKLPKETMFRVHTEDLKVVQ